MLKYILITILSLSFSISHAQDVTGVMYDDRDGQEYETVVMVYELESGVIFEHEWMTRNLNYESEGSFCYKNYQEYCNTFGRLYSWEAAKVACPEGWHMPFAHEVRLLVDKFGGKSVAGAILREGGESNLNLIPSGFGELDGAYIDVGVNGYYWKAAYNKDELDPGCLTIHSGVEYLTLDVIHDTHKNSVRCIKDHEEYLRDEH